MQQPATVSAERQKDLVAARVKALVQRIEWFFIEDDATYWNPRADKVLGANKRLSLHVLNGKT